MVDGYMNELARQRFISQTKGVVSFADVVEAISCQAEENNMHALRVSVGTDSEEISDIVKFVTIVHVWRVGRGARAYRTETIEALIDGDRKALGRIRQRIWREVMLTATLAQELRSALRESLKSSFGESLEVHADVGEGGRSSVMIREVIGVLKGYGFPDEFIKLKPEAYAASAVADHYI